MAGESLDSMVDKAFDAMCAALSGPSAAADPAAGPAIASYAPPTALDYGADETGSHLGGVESVGVVHTVGDADGEAAAVLARASASLAAVERSAGPVGPLEPSVRAQKAAKKRARRAGDNAGKKWFGLGKGPDTEEAETTLKLMRLRKYFNPKQFIKSDARKGNPKYFQIGKVVDGAADFYAADRARGKGKATLADELLNDVTFRQYHKSKFNEIQKRKARVGDYGKRRKKGPGRAGKGKGRR